MQAVQSSSLGTIPIAEKTRHLGVILTDSLTWSPHVRDILKRVGYKAFILKRLETGVGQMALSGTCS